VYTISCRYDDAGAHYDHVACMFDCVSSQHDSHSHFWLHTHTCMHTRYHAGTMMRVPTTITSFLPSRECRMTKHPATCATSALRPRTSLTFDVSASALHRCSSPRGLPRVPSSRSPKDRALCPVATCPSLDGLAVRDITRSLP